jgi:hypothetical protein
MWGRTRLVVLLPKWAASFPGGAHPARRATQCASFTWPQEQRRAGDWDGLGQPGATSTARGAEENQLLAFMKRLDPDILASLQPGSQELQDAFREVVERLLSRIALQSSMEHGGRCSSASLSVLQPSCVCRATTAGLHHKQK